MGAETTEVNVHGANPYVSDQKKKENFVKLFENTMEDAYFKAELYAKGCNDARASYGDVGPPHQRAEPAEAATEGCPQDDDGEGRRRHGLRRGVRLGGDGDAVRRGAEALQDGSPAVPVGLS